MNLPARKYTQAQAEYLARVYQTADWPHYERGQPAAPRQQQRAAIMAEFARLGPAAPNWNALSTMALKIRSGVLEWAAGEDKTQASRDRSWNAVVAKVQRLNRELANGPARRYRHVKRGTIYTLVGYSVREKNMQIQAVYCAESGEYISRPLREFLDGRFEQVDSAPPRPRDGLRPYLLERSILNAEVPESDMLALGHAIQMCDVCTRCRTRFRAAGEMRCHECLAETERAEAEWRRLDQERQRVEGERTALEKLKSEAESVRKRLDQERRQMRREREQAWRKLEAARAELLEDQRVQEEREAKLLTTLRQLQKPQPQLPGGYAARMRERLF